MNLWEFVRELKTTEYNIELHIEPDLVYLNQQLICPSIGAKEAQLFKRSFIDRLIMVNIPVCGEQGHKDAIVEIIKRRWERELRDRQ